MEIKRLQDFITQMPKDLPDLITKVRYLYLELGKRSFYDREIEYMMFGEEKDLLVYSHKEYSNPNIIICTTLNRQFIELLQSIDVEGKLAYNNEHSFVVFKDDNGVQHSTDLVRDLKNIQFRM